MKYILLALLSFNLYAKTKPLIKKGTIIYCKETREKYLDVLEDIYINSVIKASSFKNISGKKEYDLEQYSYYNKKDCTGFITRGFIVGYYTKDSEVRFKEWII